MFQKNTGVFLKAIAMGAVLANAGIAAEGEDKQRKDSSKLPSKAHTPEEAQLVNWFRNMAPVRNEIRDRGLMPSRGLDSCFIHGVDRCDIRKYRNNPRKLYGLMVEKGPGRDVHHAMILPYLVDHLKPHGKEGEVRRELLRQRREIDLSKKPIDNVLNFLSNARKYSIPGDYVLVNLVVLNATEAQLDQIRKDENAGYIGTLDWTYLSKPVADDKDEDADEDKDEKKDFDEDKDEDEDEKKFFDDKDEDEEECDEDCKKDSKWRLPKLHSSAFPIDRVGLPPLRRAAARGRYVPGAEELDENYGRKGIVAPLSVVVSDTDVAFQQGKLNPIVLKWQSTSIGKSSPSSESLGSLDIPNLGAPNEHTRHQSHNLVQIFCRKDSQMVRAQ